MQSSWNFWSDIQLVHSAIPASSMKDIDLSASLFGKTLDAPIVISAITGGHPVARKINENLASAAAENGVAMGVGSQRAGIEHPELAETYSVISKYDVPLVIGNLGAPQFVDGEKAYGVEEAQEALDMIGADILAIHLNYLQEAVQPEGETDAEGLLEALSSLSNQVPIIAKETGAGISRQNALSLKDAGVMGFDVGGLGGTSFSAVEVYRARAVGDRRRERLGELLWDWGIPTPVSIKEASVGLPIIATGGIRNGLDVMRALVMGANAGGIAGRLLKPAMEGPKQASKALEDVIEELRTVMFLSGVADLAGTTSTRWFAYEPTKSWLSSLGHNPGHGPGMNR
ncbi:MAG: type 2 isopentenyl-diphosphate Delta-isomerase [Candidatus Thermoplasmatota archaeon]|nr:type 2 isopentenyl-diphosphate Delta-isomerase [Candidatus Thermoplasmatota archaeon]